MDSVENCSLNANRNVNPSCTNAELHFLEESLQELQHFWSQEILHRQQHESRTQFCSILEKQLLYDDYLAKAAVEGTVTKKQQRKVSRQCKSEQDRVVRGEDLNDIPTTYLISGLQPHEIPVIGTYVDKSILPGFKYKVRLNQTKKYHFAGRALRLLSVGPGYGKRLTFEEDSSVKNANYFWSDNHPEGYAFSLEVLSEGDRFIIARHPEDECLRNRVVEVVRILKPQRELETECTEDGSVIKTVQLSILCRYLNDERLSDTTQDEFRLDGLATVLKPKAPSGIAKVKSVLSRDVSSTLELTQINY